MDLAQLLATLEPLLADLDAHFDANFDAIMGALDRGTDLAEYEVARFYVARALGPRVGERLRSVDPRERRAGVDAVRLTYPRAEAARVLRHLVKDPDQQVRSRARAATGALGLTDVALPLPDMRRDTRYGRPPGWNPSGWSFGLRRPRRPTRAARLSALGLPPLASPADVAALVGAADEDALAALMRPGVGRGAPYVSFEIEKASGGTRRIEAPRAALKRAQRAILDQILANIPVHAACHGFVKGRSTVTNAAPHEGAAVVVKLDLREFFPTIHYRRVAGLFAQLGYGAEVADALAGLTTHRPVLADGVLAWPGALPQGAPTSPAISNIVCWRMDRRLAGLADKFGAVYTRYADDITLSFASEPEDASSSSSLRLGRLLWWVDQIVEQEGFAENPAKRRILRRSNQQRITGVVVNAGLHVPRAERRRFRAILHNCRTHGVASQARGRADFSDYLRGYAAYVHMVEPALGARWIREVDEVLAARPGAGA